jgi:hypothetical protein
VGTVDAENGYSQSFTVDYISATFDMYYGSKFVKLLGYKGWASDVECNILKGYNFQRKLETGAIIAWHTERKDMGVHVQLSGETLRWYATKNVDWLQMLKWIKKNKGRTSRVDLALDLFNSGLKLKDFCKANLKPYKGKGRTPKAPLPVGTQEDGWTVYIGSRQSTKFLRIYDWSAKHDKDAGDYIRVELETKEEIAHAVGWEFPEQSASDFVSMAQTLIRSVADFDLENWTIALDSRDVPLAIPQGKDKDTLGWLIKTCAPSLAKEIARRPNHDVLGEFWIALQTELNSRGLSVSAISDLTTGY